MMRRNLPAGTAVKAKVPSLGWGHCSVAQIAGCVQSDTCLGDGITLRVEYDPGDLRRALRFAGLIRGCCGCLHRHVWSIRQILVARQRLAYSGIRANR